MARIVIDRTFTDTDVKSAINTMSSDLYNGTSLALLQVVTLTQTSSNAPVVTVLSDSITGVTYLRTGVGTYTANSAGKFTSGKTTPNVTGVQTTDVAGNKITAEWTSANVITIKTYGVADTAVLADGCLTNQEIQIKIYQ
jgi:hypothetical protein